MATGRKYAALPDLDAAPDTYETPELTDDNSTIPPSSLPRPESPASSQDEADEDVSTGISRRRLDPDEARSHFLASGQESADPQYTGRIKSKRKSYKESGKRGRAKDAVSVGAETSSDEDEDSLGKKLARLRREVVEVKAAFERKKTQGKTATQPTVEADGKSLEEVEQMLNSMNSQGSQTENGAASRLVKRLNGATKQRSIPAGGLGRESQPDSSYTFNYIPNYGKEHAIAKVAEFDARLTLLENALGIDRIALPTQPEPQAKAVLPTLANIDRQISIVSNSTDSTMDSTNRRIRQLTQNAQRLTEARKSAKAAQEALSNGRGIPGPPIDSHDGPNTPNLEDQEQISKINALYGTLPTIEALSPMLPSLLDRLRSLRSVHAEAAVASQNLAQIESKQEAMAEDILSWRTGLEKVEGIFAEGQRTMGGNMNAMEGWVKELEERMAKIIP